MGFWRFLRRDRVLLWAATNLPAALVWPMQDHALLLDETA